MKSTKNKEQNKQVFSKDLEVPLEIVACANIVDNYMQTNGFKQWQLLGLCSRNYVEDAEKWRKLQVEVAYLREFGNKQ